MTLLHFVWSSFAGFWAVDYEMGLMKIPGYATQRSLLEVSLPRGAAPVLVVHSLAGVFPCFHTSRSSLRYPWLTIGFSRALTSLIVPTDDANIDARLIGVRSFLCCATGSPYLAVGG